MKNLTIAGLAREAAVNVETIRFYQRQGLLAQPERPEGSIRRYDIGDAARVRFIKAAQRIGFTLSEIGQLLRLDDGAHCVEAREIAEHKLADVRQRIADLERIEVALNELVGRCTVSQGQVSCPLITSLQES